MKDIIINLIYLLIVLFMVGLALHFVEDPEIRTYKGLMEDKLECVQKLLKED